MPVRDDIDKEPMPASAKKYARMSGPSGIDGHKKLDLFNRMQADLVHTPVRAPFRPRNVAVRPDGTKIVSFVYRFLLCDPLLEWRSQRK